MSNVTKVCTVCGVDCAGMPRVKDNNGRYSCRPCYEKRLAEIEAKKNSAGAASGDPAVDLLAGSEGGVGLDVGVGEDPYALADDLLSLEASSQELEKPRCPNCSSSLAVGAQSCAQCGFDRRTNAQTAAVALTPAQMALAGIRMPPKCGNCAYSFKGITSSRCPECGWNVPIGSAHRRWAAEDSKRTVKSAYQTPMMMTIIGLLAAAAIRAGLAQHYGYSVAGTMFQYGIMYVLSYVIGFVVLVIAAKFVGYAAPLGLTMIRLAGIYAVMDAINPLLMLLPIIGWIISIFIYVQLMMSLLDLELQDAMILGVLTWVAKVFAVLVFFAMIFG